MQGYAGGPLSRRTGDALVAQGIHILCLYGATEMGNLTTIGARAEGEGDWEYVRFAAQMDVRMVRQSDGSFESQFLVRSFHPLHSKWC